MHVQSCPFVTEMQGGIHFLHHIKKCQNKAKQARIMDGQNIHPSSAFTASYNWFG